VVSNDIDSDKLYQINTNTPEKTSLWWPEYFWSITRE
jgi:hypothetical protein